MTKMQTTSHIWGRQANHKQSLRIYFANVFILKKQSFNVNLLIKIGFQSKSVMTLLTLILLMTLNALPVKTKKKPTSSFSSCLKEHYDESIPE